MNINYSKNRLRIVDFFTELRTKIDISVETYIKNNQHKPFYIDLINDARSVWISETYKCQEDNLAELEKNTDSHALLEDEQLFKCFCFVIQFYDDMCDEARHFKLRFFSTDMFLKPGQIECFEAVLNLVNPIYYTKTINRKECIERLFTDKNV
jgi:hypothetical protein